MTSFERCSPNDSGERILGQTARLLPVRFALTVVSATLAACAGGGGVRTEPGGLAPPGAKDVLGAINSGGSTNQGDAFASDVGSDDASEPIIDDGQDGQSDDASEPIIDDGQDGQSGDSEPPCGPPCEQDEQGVWGCIAILPGDPGAVTQCVDECWELVEICPAGTMCTFRADFTAECIGDGA
jgi:hypothetical protein